MARTRALAAAIQRVIDDPDLRATMTAKGFARYENEFTKDKAVSMYLDYYHEILKREGLTVTA